MKGSIKKVDRNRGYIQGEDKKEYVFDQSSLIGGLTLRQLEKEYVIGVEVEFETRPPRQPSQRPLAVNIRKLEDKRVQFFRQHALRLHELKEQYDLFCDHAEAYAQRLKVGKVTTSKIRKIYSRVLSAQTPVEIKQLRPHFAYTAGRNEDDTPGMKEFMGLLDDLARQMDVNSEQQLNNFKQFMESIVAYRKFVGDDN